MSKYHIDGSTLTAIADAIREKTKTTDGIDPVDMAELIVAISNEPQIVTTTGTITLSETAYGIEFEHGLGIIPKMCAIAPTYYYKEARYDKSDTLLCQACVWVDGKLIVANVGNGGGAEYAHGEFRDNTMGRYSPFNADEEIVRFGFPSSSSSSIGRFPAGVEYTYLIWSW